MHATKTEPASRASFLALHMNSAPRQVCLAEGGGVLGHHDGAARVIEIPRSYYAPESAGAIHLQDMKFTHYRRSDNSTDERTVGFDLLRSKSESKTEMGAGSPEQFVSILRMNNAGLSRHGGSLVMASWQNCLMFEEASAHMRRLFGSRRNEGRQGVLLTEEAIL